MLKRDNIRDAASTLAHHWTSKECMDRIGVERCLMAYPPKVRQLMIALVLQRLTGLGKTCEAQTFESWLFNLANITRD